MTEPKQRILVVDDDEMIVEQLVLIFEDAGFDVATATNALDANTILEDLHRISLVVTDIKMPGEFDGLVFAHLVAERYPDVGIIVMSGISHPDDRDVPPHTTFISKPFSPAVLLAEAKLLLEGNDPSAP